MRQSLILSDSPQRGPSTSEPAPPVAQLEPPQLAAAAAAGPPAAMPTDAAAAPAEAPSQAAAPLFAHDGHQRADGQRADVQRDDVHRADGHRADGHEEVTGGSPELHTPHPSVDQQRLYDSAMSADLAPGAPPSAALATFTPAGPATSPAADSPPLQHVFGAAVSPDFDDPQEAVKVSSLFGNISPDSGDLNAMLNGLPPPLPPRSLAAPPAPRSTNLISTAPGAGPGRALNSTAASGRTSAQRPSTRGRA